MVTRSPLLLFVSQASDHFAAVPDFDVLAVKQLTRFIERSAILGNFKIDPLHDTIFLIQKVCTIYIHGLSICSLFDASEEGRIGLVVTPVIVKRTSCKQSW